MTDTGTFAAETDNVLFRRPYVCYLTGRFCGTLANTSQAVVIAWEVYEIARQAMSVAEAAFAVGMIGLAQFLPLFALTLVAGETADRHDRRRILAACFTAQLLTAAGLAGVSHLGGGLWPVFALSAAFGAVADFVRPSVVQITVQKKAGAGLRMGGGGRGAMPENVDPKDLEEMMKKFFGQGKGFKFEKQQFAAEGTGSGFVYDDRGHILTNNHVVNGADKILVTFHDGETAPAKIVVSLPADAKLTIDDAATVSTSAVRVFVSPELPRGEEFSYTLTAEVGRDNQKVTTSKVVTVRAGRESRISLNPVVTTGVASR